MGRGGLYSEGGEWIFSVLFTKRKMSSDTLRKVG